MATGGGKSLCMYLASLASSTSAVGVVISPLVGLMDEQVTSKFSIHTIWPLLSQFGIHFKVERLSQAGVRSMHVSQAGDFKMVVSSNCRIGTFAT